MQFSHSKSLALAFVFCLLPNFGLRAQTISDTQLSPQTLTDGASLTIQSGGSVFIESGGAAVTGAGNNTISNAGTITSGDNTAIVLSSGGNTITNTNTIIGGNHGIDLQGAADATDLANAPTIRPAYDVTSTDRDAYYFNNKVINSGSAGVGASTGHGINIGGARTQIINSGTITITGGGHGIFFNTGSGQGIVVTIGNITSASGNAIAAASGINEITIHNNTGTLESTASTAIVLQSLNIIVNTGDITGGTHGIDLQGTADADTITANPTRPAYDASDDDRDAYYFNNLVINEVEGTNTGTITGASTGHGIRIGGARVQILNNGGTITASGTGQGILFAAAGQGFVANSGTITAASGNAVHAAGGVNEIVIHNTGTLESTASNAVVLRNLNLVVNTNAITGARNGIRFIGTADADTITANPTRPAYDTTETDRDAYYFNNKVINETATTGTSPPTATITGAGAGHGINIGSARAQIFNIGGDIDASNNGNGIYFDTGSGQSFVYNTGSINGFIGSAITAASGVNGIVIHNDGGTIESAGFYAIQLQSLNLIVNSGDINGSPGGATIRLEGTADDATLLAAAPAAAPAWDADKATRNAYYFNNIIINEAGGVITNGTNSHTIAVIGKRVQIFNHGDIIATGSSNCIFFDTGSGNSIVVNTGTIRSANGWGIFVHNNVDGSIVIINGGTISGGTGAIRLSTADDTLVIRTGSSITGNIDFRGGAADELIYVGIATGDRLASSALNNLETTSDSTSTSTLGVATSTSDPITPDPVTPDPVTPDPVTPTIVNTAETTARTLAANEALTVEATGSIILPSGTTGSAVIGHADGGNTITNAGEISSDDSAAIVLSGGGNTITNRGTGTITSGTDSHGINLTGTADATEVTAQGTRPAYNAGATDRDAYYFNNKVINEGDATNTGTITGTGTNGHGINIAGARVQVLNMGGTIEAENSGSGIVFNTGSGQGFVYNTGNITSRTGGAIWAVSGIDEITIHNTGTLESTLGVAMQLQSLNVIVNSGAITGQTNGIQLAGAALAATVTDNPNRPAFDATETLRDAYYFNNKVINEVVGTSTGTITGKGSNHGIRINGARAQILNAGGTITAEASGQGIVFHTGSGQSFVQNTGSITSASGNAIHAVSGINEIVIHNTGTIESTSSVAIVLRSLNLIVNSGEITGGTDSHGLDVAGGANPATIRDGPAAAPAWDASETDRDAYYFNNIVINEVGGTITGKGTGGHGIHVASKRAQIFNYGTIVAEGDGHGIYFAAASGESIVVNTGTISSATGWGIYADDATDGSIVVINGGTITGGAGAIRLSVADDTLVIRTGSNITGNVDFDDGTGDELIYAGVPASNRLATSVLLNLETTSESSSTSTLGAVTPEPTPTPDSGPDSTPDPNDGSGGGPSGGSGGGGGSGSAASLGNYATLFRLSDELILDLNAGIQDAIYEHKFSLNSEKDASENASEDTPWWTQGFGSFRAQDESDDNAKASHILGGVLVGYDLTPEQIGNLGLKDLGLPLEIKNLGFFLGVALGSLSTDDDAELITQNFFGGVNFQLAKDEFFYGVNFTLGFTSHKSERSVKESGETVNIEGKYSGFFLSPEFIIGMKTQVKFGNTAPKADSFWERMKNQVNGMEIIPSLRLRYSLALLGEYDEDGSAANRISAEKRNTGTIESRAQVAFPLQLANQAWKLEPRLGLEYRIDLNKSDFDVETLATETPIDYDAEKESSFGFFGGLSVRYLKDNTAFKFNMDTIYGSESLVLRAQAGFGFQF